MTGEAAGGGLGARPGLPGSRALVHIGLTKTGTTTMQGWLSGNRDALRRQGIHFGDIGGPRPPALGMAQGYAFAALSSLPRWMPGPVHKALFRIRGREDLLARVAEFEARVDARLPLAGGLTVISAEDIGARVGSRAAVEALDRWLSRRFAHVEYVVYLRDQVDWVPSAYTQHVRMGGFRPLEMFLERAAAYDYHALARLWAGVVGLDRFHVRLLDRAFLQGGDLLADFAGLIGADLGATGRAPNRNESMSLRRLRAVRKANALGEALARAGLPDPRARLYPLTRALDWGDKLQLTPEQAAHVARVNRASNEALRLWLFPDRPSLFPPRAAAAPQPSLAPEAPPSPSDASLGATKHA